MDLTRPSVEKDPGIQAGLPARSLGGDVLGEAECRRVQFIDGDSRHHAFVLLEVAVAVDAVPFPENPFAVRAQEGLGPVCPYAQANAILDYVGVRNDVVIEGEQRDG